MPHIHEKIDFTADVFIVYNNRVLIRKHEKYHRWLAVGGHVELDETPDQAAIREVQEEVGLKIALVSPRDIPVYNLPESEYKELVPPWYSNIHQVVNDHKHISLVYFATSESDNVAPEYEGDISNEWKWFSKEELESNELGIEDRILFYAREALKNLSS